MKLADRAGELVMAGFTGTAISPETAQQIKEDGLSGVILFTRNMQSAEQIRALTDSLQGLAPKDLPLLISIDQEGGVVARTYQITGTHLPGNMPLGATRSADLTRAAARATATELLALGINFNLAPVLDVNNNPLNPVIGVRSYGEDPHLVAELGSACVQGYQEVGVIACGKHFPGHGDTSVDSHLALPTINHGRERLESVELVPFKAAINAGIESIMTAHVFFPAYESDPGRPATLSRSVLTGLLRDQLDFAGIVITDCMEMKAIADGVGTVKAAVEAVKAGADIVLISHTPALQHQAVLALREAIESGEIPAAQVEDSLRRIEQARRKLAGVQQPAVDVLGAAEHEALAARIAESAVTVVRDDAGLLPLPQDGLGVIICRSALMSQAEEGLAKDPLLADICRSVIPGAELLIVDREPTEAQVTAAIALAQRSKSVIVATYSATHFRGQQALAEAVAKANPRTAMLAQRNPYDLRFAPATCACVAGYEDRPAMLEAAIKAMTGQGKASGRLPVTL